MVRLVSEARATIDYIYRYLSFPLHFLLIYHVNE
jgi:hypothetical protein